MLRERFFPLYIPGGKGKSSDSYEVLYQGIRRLLESEKKQMGYGYTVRLKAVNTRHAGEISMPEAIFFENVEDYVKYLGKEEEFLAFRKAAQATHKRLPALKAWMAEVPQKVVKHLDIWDELLSAALFFQGNPRPGIYARQIPGLPATFVEGHAAILAEILEAVLPPTAINTQAPGFEKRFGLKHDEPTLHIRALGDALGGLPFPHFGLPVSEAAALTPGAASIYIIPSKLDFLRFPPKPAALALHIPSEALPELAGLPFLQGKSLHFWSGISPTGFRQLSLLRRTFPHIQSICMDTGILEKYAPHTQAVKTPPQEPITHLNTQEQATLQRTLESGALSQKHIRQEDLR